MASSSLQRTTSRPTTDSTATQSPSAAPRFLRSLELISMAPSGSSRRHAGSRKIWLALNMRRPPAGNMNGNSLGAPPPGDKKNGTLVGRAGDGWRERGEPFEHLRDHQSNPAVRMADQ